MKRMALAAGLAGLLALTGCVFMQTSTYRTSYYDLAQPQPTEQKCMMLGLLNNATPARQRMLYREFGDRMVIDEYNFWVQSPEAMVSRYLFNALPLAPNCAPDKLWRMRGILTEFEINLPEKCVVIGISYEFVCGGVQKSGALNCRESFAETTPEAFAAAFSRCAERLSRELLAVGQQLSEAPDKE